VDNVDVSIIIVNYKTEALLKQTIDSVYRATTDLVYEIIVVDNASQDGSVTMVKDNFANVLIIENQENLGYAKANNIGIRNAKGKYVLLLNSDTVVIQDCIKTCFDYMEKNIDIGALGCRVELRDGKLDHACKRGFPTPEASLYYILKLDKRHPDSKKFGKYDLTYLPENEINEVDCLIGAFMLVRNEVIDKIGLLDEEFFMYGEDIDWCYRIKEAGWKIVYYPETKIIHYKGQSSKKRRFMTIYEFHRAMYLFYNKHYYKKYNKVVRLLVYAGIGVKLGLTLLLNLFKRRD
jgi:GT2 family glycosyltransferase